MTSKSIQRVLGPVATWVCRVSTVLFVLWLALVILNRWDKDVHTMEDWRARLLLTLGGAAAISWLAMLMTRTLRVFPRSSFTGLVALALLLVSFALLVWTPLKTGPTLWRFWWLGVVASATVAHVLVLRTLTLRKPSKLAKTTIAAAIACAAALATVSFRRDILSDPHPLLVAGLAFFGTISVLGTFIAWRRYRRSHPRPTPAFIRYARAITWQAGLLLLAFYAGRLSVPPPVAMDMAPSALAHLSPAELDTQWSDDLRRLRVLCAGVDDLTAKALALHADLSAKRKADARAYYLPEEDDAVRAQYMSYLAYRAALLRLVATYANFQSVRDP